MVIINIGQVSSSSRVCVAGEEEDTAVMDDIVAAFCRRCQDFNCERHGDIFQHTDNAEVKADTVIGHADGEPSKEFESHARQWSTPCGSGCHTLPLEVTASSQASASKASNDQTYAPLIVYGYLIPIQ